MPQHQTVSFSLNDMLFEYDEEKNRTNIKKHGISFKAAARVFFDYDRIELYDEENSMEEDRYDVIGDTSAGTTIGNIDRFADDVDDILYVVYTERESREISGSTQIVTRLISARMATSFERGLYFGKQR